MDTATLDPAAFAIAEEQAALDRAYLDALRKRQVSEVILDEVAEYEGDDPKVFTPMPMNRAQRRQRVKVYAALLASTERQVPFVHPTTVPKSKRRRR